MMKRRALKADGNGQDEQQESGRGRELKGKNRSREENQECIARRNSNSTSTIALIHNTRMMSLGAHLDTKEPITGPWEPVLAPLNPSRQELTLSTVV